MSPPIHVTHNRVLLQPQPVVAAAGGGTAPTVQSMEIGLSSAAADNKTIVVTYDIDIAASDATAGWTIDVGPNSDVRTIASATIQADKTKLHIVLNAGADGTEQVDLAYSKASGNIVADSDATPKEDMAATSATNTCFDPSTDLSGTIHWWKARNELGSQDDPVTTWDEEVTSDDFTGSGTGRPLLQLNETDGNGLNTLLFDGVNDTMNTGTAISSYWTTSGTRQYTYWVVFHPVGAGSVDPANWYEADCIIGDANNYHGVTYTSVPDLHIFTNVGGSDLTILNQTCAADATHVVEVRYLTDTLYGIIDNGSEQSNGTGTIANVVDNLSIGDGGYSEFGGHIMEIIMSTLSETAANRQKVREYLGDVHGVTV